MYAETDIEFKSTHTSSSSPPTACPYVVIEYGATFGSNACHTNGIPCARPAASNRRAATTPLNASMLAWNRPAAAVMAARPSPASSAASSNMCTSVRSVATSKGRAKSALSVNCAMQRSRGGRKAARAAEEVVLVVPLVVGSGW